MAFNRDGYIYNMSENSQVHQKELQQLALKRDFVEGLLSPRTGHADIHYINTNLDKRLSMTQIFADYGYNNMHYTQALPQDINIIQNEINRVAQECVQASHFVGQPEILNALGDILHMHAKDIVSWIDKFDDKRGSKFETERKDFTFKITIDTGNFVGSGIGKDGNQYATTVVTAIFNAAYSNPGYDYKVPFSLVTIYPDISQKHEIGSLVATGNNFAEQIKAAAEKSTNPCTRIYWAMKAAGKDVTFEPPTSTHPARVKVKSEYEGQPYIAIYDEKFEWNGSCRIYEDGLLKPLRHTTLSDEMEEAIYNHENNTLSHIARNALNQNISLFENGDPFVGQNNTPNVIRGYLDLETEETQFDETIQTIEQTTYNEEEI